MNTEQDPCSNKRPANRGLSLYYIGLGLFYIGMWVALALFAAQKGHGH